MEKSIDLKLTIPPSINMAYNWKNRRFKSKQYKQWEKIAWMEMRWQKQFEITWNKWLVADYTYFTPLFCKNRNKKIWDVGNYGKLLTDFLTHEIKGFKDEHIKELHLKKEDSQNLKVLIKIYEYD